MRGAVGRSASGVVLITALLVASSRWAWWPPCGARQNEVWQSSKAVVSLPGAVEALLGPPGEYQGTVVLCRCRSPDKRRKAAMNVGRRRAFPVKAGYRARDEPRCVGFDYHARDRPEHDNWLLLLIPVMRFVFIFHLSFSFASAKAERIGRRSISALFFMGFYSII